MKFEDFIKSGQVKKAARDIQLATALVDTAEQDLKFLEPIAVKNHPSEKGGMLLSQTIPVVFEHSRNSTIRFVVEFTKPPSIAKVEFRCFNNRVFNIF